MNVLREHERSEKAREKRNPAQLRDLGTHLRGRQQVQERSDQRNDPWNELDVDHGG
jgi:hypothetical protein